MDTVKLYTEIDLVTDWLIAQKSVIVLATHDYHKDAQYANGFYGYLLKAQHHEWVNAYELPMQRLCDSDSYYVQTGLYIGKQLAHATIKPCLTTLQRDYPIVFNHNTVVYLFDSVERPDPDRLLKMFKRLEIL